MGAIVAVLVGACGAETPPESAEPAQAVKVDPAGAALVFGNWSMPDGAGCAYLASFDGSALLERVCYPGDGTAQVDRIYGPFEVQTTDVPDPPADAKVRTLSRLIVLTAKDPSCSARGEVLTFDAQITGGQMVLVGPDGARTLSKGFADGPAVARVLLGCFAADGTFSEPAPRPL